MTGRSDDAVQWLAATRSGSKEALGQLLEASRCYLLLVAQKELDPDLRAKGGASDLVQQTFLEAQRDFAQFRGDSEDELLAWLRRLLLNNLANFTRHFRATGKRALDREVALEGGSSGHGLASGLAAGSSTPSGQAVMNEQAQALQRALEHLPDDYRLILLLRYQEGRSFEEIAGLMHRSANAVRKLCLRAIDRIQKELDASP